jgi:hypothetical protein
MSPGPIIYAGDSASARQLLVKQERERMQALRHKRMVEPYILLIEAPPGNERGKKNSERSLAVV